MTGAPKSASAESPSVTLEYLLRRMRFKADFPALSSSVARVQSLAVSETENLQTVCDEILQDVALTQKLLRLVNTAHFRRAGSDQISTVSRAVAMVGMAGVRNMALSLMLLDHMPDRGHAQQMKTEFLRSVMAGTMAAELSHTSKEAEAAYIGALFRNLGRLLVAYYLPEDAEQIRVQAKAKFPGRDISLAEEAQVSATVLGMSFDDLGLAVGAQWGLPDTVVQCMAMPSTDIPNRSQAGKPERTRWLASLANDAAESMLISQPAELGEVLSDLNERYAKALDLPPDAVQEAAGRARKRMSEVTEALNFVIPANSPAERLVDHYYVDAPNAGGEVFDPEDLGLDTANGPLTQTVPLLETQSAADILAAGIQDITNTLVDQFRLNDVLQMILEAMWRGLNCRRVVFCLKDPKSGALVGRIAMGDHADQIKGLFKVPVDGVNVNTADLFAAVCMKNLDTLIADASTASVSARLPQWFAQYVKAPTFLLLPMVVKRGQQSIVLGLIYADREAPYTLQINERELSLLRTLRNQAIMAFKQSTGG